MAAVLCTIYVSESAMRYIGPLRSLVVGIGKARLADSFCDVTYNRTSFLLIGKTEDVKYTALSLCTEVFGLLDFREHRGTHPTLGTVDHVCFSPLGNMDIECVAELASAFCQHIAGEINIPVYAYGAVFSPTKRNLKDIRKELGYFKNRPIDAVPIKAAADFGANCSPEDIQKRGVMCVGAVPFVLNFNLRFRPNDPKALVSKISSSVRVPDKVEALTLQHIGGAYEVACNLLRPREEGVRKEDVYSKAEAIARELGVEIVDAYTTGPLEDELIEMLRETENSTLIPGSDGV